MKNWFNTKVFFFISMLLLSFGLMQTSIYAKSRSSGGGFGGSKTSYKSSGWSSKPKTNSWNKPKTNSWNSNKKVTSSKKSGGGFGKSKKVDTNSAKYKATNKNITKNFGVSKKKYSSKAEAKKDLSSKMAAKKYDYKDSKTAMANRPAHIPQSYQGHTTVYMNGRYGYYDPMGTFMAYTAAQMIVNDAMMYSYAPHMYNNYQHPVVVHQSSDFVFLIAVGTILGLFFIAIVIIKVIG